MHPFNFNLNIQMNDIGVECADQSATERHLPATRVKNRPADDRPAPTCRPEFSSFYFFFKLKKIRGGATMAPLRQKKRSRRCRLCASPFLSQQRHLCSPPFRWEEDTSEEKIQRRHFFFFFKKRGKRTNLGRGLFDHVRHLRIHSETLCGRVPLIFVSICC